VLESALKVRSPKRKEFSIGITREGELYLPNYASRIPILMLHQIREMLPHEQNHYRFKD
jgi:hypothetical protein